jgi:hypothetical protein
VTRVAARAQDEPVKTRVKRLLKDGLANALVLLAIIAAFFIAVGALALSRDASCDQLNEERIAHLEPGHDTPGPGVTYVLGRGEDVEQLTLYYEAVSAMERAGCEVPT